MLHLFRRGDDDGSAGGSVLASHILGKFLKRLVRMDRPHLLDLGRLSGSNIEFFANAHCRVQVDDLIGGGVPEAAGGDAARPDPATEPSAPVALDGTDAGSNAGAPEGWTAGAGTGRGAARPRSDPFARIGTVQHSPAMPGRPGARPSRRVVLPPRTFGRPATATDAAARTPNRPGSSTTSAGRPGTIAPRDLPRAFAYPDESFDAIVAWDIFNFYDAPAIRDLAAEVRRVLRPGGLLLAYFHARRLDRPDHPRRYRILDDARVAFEAATDVPLVRHVYQNRDIEKLFTGMTIVELYFLKNSMREFLMEKKAPKSGDNQPIVRAATGRSPRFTIE